MLYKLECITDFSKEHRKTPSSHYEKPKNSYGPRLNDASLKVDLLDHLVSKGKWLPCILTAHCLLALWRPSDHGIISSTVYQFHVSCTGF